MQGSHKLKLKRLKIRTYKEAVIYLFEGSYICKSEGFGSQSRVRIALGKKNILATLNIVIDESLLNSNEAGLSEFAWELLDAKEGAEVEISHPSPLNSMNHIRSKIYGQELDQHAFDEIIRDMVDGNLSDIQISSFITACAGNKVTRNEIMSLTEAMVKVGTKISWPKEMIVDKHSLGGIPGNRTTMIVVPIVAAFGLTIPKTSSRAITSPAGTADTMEVLAPVNLSLSQMRKVVEKENGCIAWGASALLSPADEVMIRIERVLNFDSQIQAVASVLSKKISAGSTHVLIDIPFGPMAKARTEDEMQSMKNTLESIGKSLGLKVKSIFTDGSKPIGRGIGPVLEALDVIAVLENKHNAPLDLRDKACVLAGQILEFAPHVKSGEGIKIAREILKSGKAWKKFVAICDAQGGMREPKKAPFTLNYEASSSGKITAINIRHLSLLAKLAGAPNSPGAGVYLDVNVGSDVTKGQKMLTIYSATPGELDYAFTFLNSGHEVFSVVS